MPTSPAAPPSPPPKPRRWRRALAWLGLALLLAAVAAGFWLRGRLLASLPQLAGRASIAGLSAAVVVERDELGVPTITAANRLDAARALGFLHAQERFFQMDLLRRSAAGELAELFGKAALDVDAQVRVQRFRAVARRALAAAPAAQRAVVEAYTAGVNAGLTALGAPPFEYVLARAAPAPWQAEDCYLGPLAMFILLHGESIDTERRFALLAPRLPAALRDFLAPWGTELDAPLSGEPLPTPPVPGPEVYDLRTAPPLPKAARWSPSALPALAGLWRAPETAGERLGSNNWAVSGAHSADGRAWLANDMHLGLGVPNTWYRAVLRWRDGDGAVRQIVGVTLPGVPALVVGSNGRIAWGFTNSYGDFTDWVLLESDPARPDVYRTPAGWKAFERHDEVIHVKASEDLHLLVRETEWGPVVDEDPSGRLRVLAWTARQPGAVSFDGLALETAESLEEAAEIAHRSGMPPQNFTMVDAEGRIGWTIAGRLPRRVGFDGRSPESWADGSRRWEGLLDSAEVPTLLDPPLGRLWTANARTVGGEELARLGDGGYDHGARARQIRDDLLALERATPRDLLAIQLDDRALFLERWRELLLRTLDASALAGQAERTEMRRLVADGWTGRAEVGSVAHRLVRAFRTTLRHQVLSSIVGDDQLPAAERYQPTPQFEGPLWRLVSEQPAHLLAPQHASWREQLLAAVDAALADLRRSGSHLADRSWGERNTARIRHPLSAAVPFLGRWLDMPARPLPGDDAMPRVQAPTFGASERLVVSPGQEEKSFFHMPGGQSGHPLSPYYRRGHAAWESGEPTPLLPGPTVHHLELVAPAGP